ncbi:MAG: PEP-CTERM sorting domain-containing protein, partial [Planctomycetota bacterium]
VWNSNKFTNNPAWCSGDFNADGFVDVGDFNAWNSNKFTSSDAAAVPEPASLVTLLMGCLALMGIRRRR